MSLFALSVGDTTWSKPIILWFLTRPISAIFGRLDHIPFDPETRSLKCASKRSPKVAGSSLFSPSWQSLAGGSCHGSPFSSGCSFFTRWLSFATQTGPSPAEPNAVVAAADGVVADIMEIDEPDVLKTRMRRVGIFLSVFDVHTNRAPVEGRVTYREHREGLCLDARRQDCSEKNESMTWAFQNPRTTLVVRQLTGAIARRIVGWSKVGDELKKGERFGMIRFGSRTEVYLPLTATIVVNVGDRVAGGSTIIARLAD